MTIRAAEIDCYFDKKMGKDWCRRPFTFYRCKKLKGRRRQTRKDLWPGEALIRSITCILLERGLDLEKMQLLLTSQGQRSLSSH